MAYDVGSINPFSRAWRFVYQASRRVRDCGSAIFIVIQIASVYVLDDALSNEYLHIAEQWHLVIMAGVYAVIGCTIVRAVAKNWTAFQIAIDRVRRDLRQRSF